jgi:glycine cleavage system regulatory protein
MDYVKLYEIVIRHKDRHSEWVAKIKHNQGGNLCESHLEMFIGSSSKFSVLITKPPAHL